MPLFFVSSIVDCQKKKHKMEWCQTDFGTITTFSVTSFAFIGNHLVEYFVFGSLLCASPTLSIWLGCSKIQFFARNFWPRKEFPLGKSAAFRSQKDKSKYIHFRKKNPSLCTKTLNYLFAIICLPWPCRRSVSTFVPATRTVRLFHLAALINWIIKGFANLH